MYHKISKLWLILSILLFSSYSLALIRGGEGNSPFFGDANGEPVDGPKGVAPVANHPSRIGWWEGPPFGGGNFHFEYRGDSKTLSEVISRFAGIQSEHKYIVLHEGIGRSFWLNIGDRKKDDPDLDLDWTFEFWLKNHEQYAHQITSKDEPENFHFAPRIHVFTGGSAKWEEIKVPENVTVVDRRLSAHGFTDDDGSVAEGFITDLQTGQPIVGANVRMEVNKPTAENKYNYVPENTVKTDANGRWFFTHLPDTGCRFISSNDQYVNRFLGYASGGQTPGWNKINGGLSRPVSFSGTVMDTEGKGIPDAKVRLIWITGPDGIYESDEKGYEIATDGNGRFIFEQIPPGTGSCATSKDGYVMQNNMAVKVSAPGTDQKISMIQAASLKVKVIFKNGPPKGEYRVGLFKKNNYQISSHDAVTDADCIARLQYVLPGDYFVIGHPNPHSEKEKSQPVPISLKPGEHQQIEISAN